MEKYIDQDITETGDQKFTFAWTGNDGDANLSVNISKYMSISSLLRGESAVDVVADYTLVVNTKSRKKYDWETEKEVDEPAKNISIVGKVSAEAKVLDDDLYVQLREFTAVATGNDDRMLKDINESVTEITPYIGTTYKLSGMGDGAITQDNILETMDKMMSVLETQPLMTAKKKVKNGYELGFKLSTFQSLNKAMGRKKNAGMNDLKMAGKMIYSKTENGMKIDWKQVTRYTKGEAELTYTNGKYVISGSTVGK